MPNREILRFLFQNHWNQLLAGCPVCFLAILLIILKFAVWASCCLELILLRGHLYPVWNLLCGHFLFCKIAWLCLRFVLGQVVVARFRKFCLSFYVVMFLFCYFFCSRLFFFKSSQVLFSTD
jgi:hypothetical protein